MNKLDLSVGRAPWAPTRKRVFRYRDIEFYADKGYIHFLDTRTGTVNHCTLQDLKQRLWAFQNGIGRVVAVDLYRAITKLLEEGKMTLQQGLAQGDPFCPKAQREMMIRKPARIVIPGLASHEVNAPSPAPLYIPGGR